MSSAISKYCSCENSATRGLFFVVNVLRYWVQQIWVKLFFPQLCYLLCCRGKISVTGGKNTKIEQDIYTPFRNERDNLFHYFSVMKSSKNKFYFSTCILPDYVIYESQTEFWKNRHFENTRVGFLLRGQNWLRQNSPKMRHKKERF